MNKLLSILLFFIPHPLNVGVRKIMKQRIGQNTKIHMFSFVLARDLVIGDNAHISPFSFLKANQIFIGDFSHVAPFVIVNAPLIKNANFNIGRHSRIFPFCWIEPGEGVYIGNHVGVGGHTLIFTHGSWSSYLHGGPVSFGPVHINDHVWLPWRVFVMPGVTIGEYSIIGANSTVTNSVPSNSLAAGSPAKVVKDNINLDLEKDAFETRVQKIFSEFEIYQERVGRPVVNFSKNSIYFYRSLLNERQLSSAELNIDMSLHIYETTKNDMVIKDFVSFLRRYGIRLEPK